MVPQPGHIMPESPGGGASAAQAWAAIKAASRRARLLAAYRICRRETSALCRQEREQKRCARPPLRHAMNAVPHFSQCRSCILRR